MIKLTLLIFLFLIISTTSTSQAGKIAKILTSCNDSSILNLADTSIYFPNSNRHLKLPKNWCADFYGELPMLHTQKNNDSVTFNVRGNQAWDTFPKDELFNFIKNDTIKILSFEEFSYHNHIFLLTQHKEHK